MNKHFLIAISIIIFSLPGQAQNFLYKAKINPVSQSGFHKICLTPALSAKAKSDLSDVRMFDNTGKEIPFLYKKESALQQFTDFVSYSFEENTSNANWQILIVQNLGKEKIDRFLLELNNAETGRKMRVSGSNDQNQWYVIQDSTYLSILGESADAVIQAQIKFPKSDYKYFKIEIDRNNKLPLRINQVGYSQTEVQVAKYSHVDGLQFSTKDSNKSTYLNFILNPANRIDQMVFHISSPSLYKRQAILEKEVVEQNSMYSGSSRRLNKRKPIQTTYKKEFELISEQSSKISTFDLFGNDKIASFRLQIKNEDNEALKVDSVSAYQLSDFLIAEMQKDKSYFLYFGDSLIEAPNYDLIYFENKITASATIINIGAVQAKNAKIEDEYDQSRDKIIIWIGIALIAVILFFMTTSMMKKMKKEESTQ